MNRPLLASLLTAALALPAVAADDKAGPNDNKPPEGFTALFNGTDLTNWKGNVPINQRKGSQEEMEKRQKAADEKTLPHWKVVDGILTYDGKGDSLQTARDYGDFELFIDWKIEMNGDSGIYLRGQPQVQVWDSDNSPGARGEDKHSGSGGLWNNPLPKGADPKSIGKMPLKKADKPIGEWNTFRIIMKGENVTVYLNGELVVDNKPLAPYKAFNDKLPEKGPIELQHHGDKLWFKNIYIKELK
jgi:3-keto-disaccharide hydrolase